MGYGRVWISMERTVTQKRKQGKDGKKNIEGGNPKEADKKLEENKWPCGVCEENVTDDGFECVVCNNWYHAGECTETTSSSEFKNKPYTCKKCLEKSGGRAKKAKADEKVKKKPGRPSQRDRRHSNPCSLEEKNKDRIEKNIQNIESKRKRNINEVVSPGKAEVTLEEKKMKKDGEWTEKKEDGKKKVEEEDKHLSPLKNLFNPLKRLFSSEDKVKKQKEKEEKEKDKEAEREQKKD